MQIKFVDKSYIHNMIILCNYSEKLASIFFLEMIHVRLEEIKNHNVYKRNYLFVKVFKS